MSQLDEAMAKKQADFDERGWGHWLKLGDGFCDLEGGFTAEQLRQIADGIDDLARIKGWEKDIQKWQADLAALPSKK
jgi:hypothetical protein